MSYQCTEDEFLKDVADHQMITLHDDGVYRHIRFKKPETGCMHFDLVTWPGYLAYSGDMGCYVFCRLQDMFEFFRTDREYKKRDGQKLAINLGYWSEKLQAVDGSRNSASATEFSEEKFDRAVIEHLVGWVRENAYQTTKDERRELWDAVMSDVIGADGDSGGYRKQVAANDFHHFVNKEVGGSFYFQDFWEHDFTEYTHRFVWCCYALAWGIEQYDNAKEKVAVAA
jgi:hypothetical protein